MYHVPVLLEESVSGLNIDPDGVYLDLTFGGGGHSREILKRLKDGCLIGFDQDSDALANVPDDSRFIFVNHNFRYLRNFLRYCGYDEADGILADLGVSSHEFDEAGRGFSFRFDAELDMRMNQRSRLKATDILNTYSEEDLTRIFRNYGEVDNVRRLVDLIVKARTEKMITRSEEFLQVIAPCVPKQKEKKYLAQVYQALRIEVNGELEALEDMLKEAERALRPGGRLVVITYHSLEDRIVKNFLKSGNFEGKVEKDFYGHVKRNFELVNRKVIVPSEEEIERNPRARSAKLRIAEKRKDDKGDL
ncbi:MAG: 16S rRNA (cytosine(1402)-N(4))-methyltransferase RsmH [Butyricimonas faecihominis]